MKNIYEILKGIGLEVPEDKKAAFDKEWKENYRTKSEYDNAVTKRDEYKASLDDVQKKLDAFKDVNVDDLKGQVDTLTKRLSDEKAARAKDEARHTLEKTVDAFMGEKQFVNDITAVSIREKLMEALDSDAAKGKSIEDIFKGIVSDKDGKPLPNIMVEGGPKVRFTQPMGMPKPGTKLTPSELMKLANENPGLDIKQYM